MLAETSKIICPGVTHWPGYFDAASQQSLLDLIRTAVGDSPLFTPKMPRTGREMSVRMTNFGSLGWVTDKENGYRYQALHPTAGNAWPAIPESLLELWSSLADFPLPPQACLVNYYNADAKMGMHQDRDEQEFDAPVISVSLGDACLFRVGGVRRGGRTKSIRLNSGDVMMLSGPSRLAFHGVDRIYPQSSALLKTGGRINLTLRRVTPAHPTAQGVAD
jgi:alkylated DNA repair protein (DNA oxidative demethylase)